MLIPLKDLQTKYNINLKTVLHVGAHKAEELGSYQELGAKHVIWVEANRLLAANLRLLLDPKFNSIILGVVSDKDDEKVWFNVSNNLQSSSILELGEHSSLFPDVHYCTKEERQTTTIKSILTNLGLGFEDIGMFNLDIQGAELLALKGCGEEISKIPYIYTEINTRPVYQGCAILPELDEYLFRYGFERKETMLWENHPWGDAFYVNNNV